MLVVIHPLVRLLLGPVWAPSAQASAVLIVITMYGFLYAPSGTALVARGITRFTLAWMSVLTVLTLAGVVVVRPTTPHGAVWVWAAAQAIVYPAMQYGTARLLGDRVWRQIRAGLPALALAIAAVAAALLVPKALGEPRQPLPLMAERLAFGGGGVSAGGGAAAARQRRWRRCAPSACGASRRDRWRRRHTAPRPTGPTGAARTAEPLPRLWR